MSRDGKSQQKRPGRGQMSRESVEASAGTGLSWWGRRAGFGFFQGEGKERFLGEEGFFLHDTPPSGSNPCCSWMNRYSEHMIQEQMFSSSLFEMAKIRIDSEPKQKDVQYSHLLASVLPAGGSCCAAALSPPARSFHLDPEMNY